MGARDQDGPDPGLDESGELVGDAFHGAARLHVVVEQVAGDEDEVHAFRDGEVHGGHERGELPLALGRRRVPEVGVPGAEMDVRGVEQSEHAGGCLPVGPAG